MEARTYEEHGCRIVEDICPDGFVVIDEYNPCPTVTPWDGYGISHQIEYGKVLEAAGIKFVPLRIHRTILHPMGTGPKGRVRFGDNMRPGTYLIAVAKADENAANVAIANHREELRKWLADASLPMPEACRR